MKVFSGMEEACHTGLWVLVLLYSAALLAGVTDTYHQACHGDERVLQKTLTLISVELKGYEQICIWINGPLNNRTLIPLHTASSVLNSYQRPCCPQFTGFLIHISPLDKALLEVLIQEVTKEPELSSSTVAFSKDNLRTATLGSYSP